MPRTVLITGFGPFPGAPFNPTEALVRRLARRRRPAFADIDRVAHVFRTSYAAVDQDLPRLLARHHPDVLLMFGLAARTRYVRIETCARNAISALVPDVGGSMARIPCIQAGGAGAQAGRAPFQKLVRAVRVAGMSARLSRDAGAYLCNYVYWRASQAKSRHGLVPIVVFIHVPAIGRARRPRGKNRRATLADLSRAGEAILLALVSAARACPPLR